MPRMRKPFLLVAFLTCVFELLALAWFVNRAGTHDDVDAREPEAFLMIAFVFVPCGILYIACFAIGVLKDARIFFRGLQKIVKEDLEV